MKQYNTSVLLQLKVLLHTVEQKPTNTYSTVISPRIRQCTCLSVKLSVSVSVSLLLAMGPGVTQILNTASSCTVHTNMQLTVSSLFSHISLIEFLVNQRTVARDDSSTFPLLTFFPVVFILKKDRLYQVTCRSRKLPVASYL